MVRKNCILVGLMVSLCAVVSSSYTIANRQYSDSVGNVDVNLSAGAQAYSFDTTEFSSDNTTLINGTQFVAQQTGIYKITYTLNWSTSNTARRQIRTFLRKNGLTEINGGVAYGYARRSDQAESATNSASTLVALQVNDYVELMYQRNSSVLGTALSIAGETSIIIETLESVSGTGQFGNIALTGTNGLTSTSYSASSTNEDAFGVSPRGVPSPEGVFDGYYNGALINDSVILNRINDDAGIPVVHSAWYSESPANEWLQVDFGWTIAISGFRVVIQNPASTNALPKSVIVQGSDDGINFTNHESFTLTQITDQTVTLATPMSSRFFRLFMIDNHGQNSVIFIEELEIYD